MCWASQIALANEGAIDGDVTVFTYDEWKPIVEWNSETDFVAWIFYGPGADEILVRYQPNTRTP